MAMDVPVLSLRLGSDAEISLDLHEDGTALLTLADADMSISARLTLRELELFLCLTDTAVGDLKRWVREDA